MQRDDFPVSFPRRKNISVGSIAVTEVVSFSRADLRQATDRQVFFELSQDYFKWMDREMAQSCGFSIPSVVNMTLSDYVLYATESAADISPQAGGIYFLRDPHGNTVAMGGLRPLPNGNAEVVRVYTRPQSRRRGHGTTMIQYLISEASRLGYPELCLDTGIFMPSAQKLYRAAGFSACGPYPGSEPSQALTPYLVFMKLSL